MAFPGLDYGEIVGLDFNKETNELIVLANRGQRIVLGMPKDFYPGYDREIHEVYVYSIIDEEDETESSAIAWREKDCSICICVKVEVYTLIVSLTKT